MPQYIPYSLYPLTSPIRQHLARRRHETSWRLQVLKGDDWIIVASGPPGNSNFSGNTRYVGKSKTVLNDYVSGRD